MKVIVLPNPGQRLRSFFFAAAWRLFLIVLLLGRTAVGGQETVPADPPENLSDLMELSFDQLLDLKVDSVYGASKFEQKIARAPAAVSIVTSEEIKMHGYRTLADLLRSVRGFYVSNDRNYSYLGVRGFNRPGDYNTRILLLVNGHRFNDNIYDSALLGTEFPVDIDLVDRVEVIRGPGSSIYGNSAFFGVINVITKQGRHLDGAVVSGAAGSWDSYQGRFSYGKKWANEVELLLSGSYYNSDGPARLFYPEYDRPDRNFGVAERADCDQFHNYLVSLSYRGLSLSGAYGSREKGIPTGAYGTDFNDPGNYTIDERTWADLRYTRSFERDLELMVRAYYDHYHYQGQYLYSSVKNRDYAIGHWWGTEAQLTQRLFDRHTLIAGVEFRDNFRQDQGNFDIFPSAIYLDDRRSSQTWGLFSQAEIALRTNVILNAGLRYDWHSEIEDSLNPRLGLIFQPAPQSAFKLLYGTAFRAPNAYELYYFGAGNKSNPDLDPETIQTYELVYEQELAKYLRLSASAYYYQVEDLISQRLDPASGLIGFENLERAEARGVEAGLETRGLHGWRGRCSYALQTAEDGKTGEPLSNSPRHLAKFNLIAPLYQGKLFAGLELQYNGQVRTLAGSRADDFVIANFTLFSQKIVQGLEMSASIYNLFDASYGYPGASEHLQDILRQDGRSFRFKLTYRF